MTEQGPLRRCITTRSAKPQRSLLRFVVRADDTLHFDVGDNHPGRGLWLSPGRNMIKTASARNLFSRAARQRVHVPDDLADQVEGLLARRCLDYVGLAWRRNGVAIGSETAREILGTTKPALLLVATGSSRDEIARFVDGDPKAIGLPVCDVFRSAELSAALGRNVVNCALVYGKWSERIAGDVQRLRAMRIET